MQDDWMQHLEKKGFGEVHFKVDQATGLRSIIAIHDLTAGPSLGGCRLRTYASTNEGMEDVLRLARGMTLKSVLAGVPCGGGKAIIFMPEEEEWDRKALFSAFGRFVDSLGGRYISAIDMGTTVDDMDAIGAQTPYVTCTSHTNVGPSDPSTLTALGVHCGLRAAVKSQLGKETLDGLHVVIQGVGNVGMDLAKRLALDGARLTVCDASEENVAYCVEHLGAEACAPEAIYDVPCDVFSPCAIGGILDSNSIARLKTTIVAGAANNQLAKSAHGQELANKGILYAPDFVINAGGIIHVASQYTKDTEKVILDRVERIYNTCMLVFENAKSQNKPTSETAEAMALAQLAVLKSEQATT